MDIRRCTAYGRVWHTNDRPGTLSECDNRCASRPPSLHAPASRLFERSLGVALPRRVLAPPRSIMGVWVGRVGVCQDTAQDVWVGTGGAPSPPGAAAREVERWS